MTYKDDMSSAAHIPSDFGRDTFGSSRRIQRIEEHHERFFFVWAILSDDVPQKPDKNPAPMARNVFVNNNVFEIISRRFLSFKSRNHLPAQDPMSNPVPSVSQETRNL